MIIAATPKKFDGHIGVIQDNAISSWIQIFGSKSIYLFGNEETAINAKRLGVNYKIPEYSNTDVPLFNSIINICRDMSNDVILYTNSDIIFLENVTDMANINFELNNIMHSSIGSLLIGSRTNIDLEEKINFSDPDCRKNLFSTASTGKLSAPEWIDYFVFSGQATDDMPPLRIGRGGFDNYILYLMKKRRIPIVDITKSILAIHQNHSYSHHPEGKQGIWYGEDARENLRIAGGYHAYLSLDDADYIYNSGILIKNRHRLRYFLSRKYLKGILLIRYPLLSCLYKTYRKIKSIFTHHGLQDL